MHDGLIDVEPLDAILHRLHAVLAIVSDPNVQHALGQVCMKVEAYRQWLIDWEQPDLVEKYYPLSMEPR